jgi:hypothetical protein
VPCWVLPVRSHAVLCCAVPYPHLPSCVPGVQDVALALLRAKAAVAEVEATEGTMVGPDGKLTELGEAKAFPAMERLSDLEYAADPAAEAFRETARIVWPGLLHLTSPHHSICCIMPHHPYVALTHRPYVAPHPSSICCPSPHHPFVSPDPIIHMLPLTTHHPVQILHFTTPSMGCPGCCCRYLYTIHTCGPSASACKHISHLAPTCGPPVTEPSQRHLVYMYI